MSVIPIVVRLVRRFGGSDASLSFVGLTLGIAALSLALSVLRFETGFDTWLADSGRLYRIDTPSEGTPPSAHAVTPSGLAPWLREGAIREVEAVVRLGQPVRASLTSETEPRRLVNATLPFADPELIAMFGLPLVAGDPESALARPDAVVLTESLARRLFGDADPMSRTVEFGDGSLGIVTALMRDLPADTHLRFDGLRPISAPAANLPGGGVGQWNIQDVFTYVRLSGRPTPAQAARVQSMTGTYGNPSLADRLAAEPWPVDDVFRPVTAIYLDGPSNMRPQGNRLLVAAVAGVAAVIAIFAVSNFAAFQSAQLTGRTREVGIRKCLGATPRNIVGDVLLEGMLLAVLATAMALAIVELLSASFPWLPFRQSGGQWWYDPAVLAGTFTAAQLAVALGTVGGAIRLGAARPFRLLSERTGPILRGGGWLRLVILGQFASSFCLLVLAVGIALQVDHVGRFDRKVAFVDRWEVVSGISPTSERLVEAGDRLAVLRDEVLRLPGVIAATANIGGLPATDQNSVVLAPTGDRPAQQIAAISADPAFARTFGLPLLAGRFLSKDFVADRLQSGPEGLRGAAVVSRATLQLLGLGSPDAALGAGFEILRGAGRARLTIVGVAEDAHWAGAKATPGPLIYLYDPSLWFSLTYHAEPAAAETLRDEVRRLAQTLLADTATVEPLQNRLDLLLREERQLARSFWLFAAVASAVAAAGLYGLTQFLVERQARQVAIRRVFGASRTQVFGWLGGRMLLPVLVVLGLAAPIAYLLVERWLSAYAQRFDPGPLLLVGPGLLLLGLAGMTVAASVYRVTSRPPQQTLGGDARN